MLQMGSNPGCAFAAPTGHVAEIASMAQMSSSTAIMDVLHAELSTNSQLGVSLSLLLLLLLLNESDNDILGPFVLGNCACNGRVSVRTTLMI